jgi:4-hydroxy-2-oxoheptanedioate aldolase
MNARSDFMAGLLGKKQRLLGCAINSGNPRLAELAARLGFEVIWIDLEHASADLASAEAMCLATLAGGGVPLVRVASCRRDHVLPAVEIGGRIIVAPLVNDAAAARELVRHAKFRPVGERGYNTRSRALGYGLRSDAIARANDSICLLPQIEVIEAVAKVAEILAVEGIDGIFVGPGDLSADLGRPGQFEDVELRRLVCEAIRCAKQRGFHAGILVSEGQLLNEALQAGADLCIIASDMKAVIDTWRAQLARLADA